jgi:hypothetical protein
MVHLALQGPDEELERYLADRWPPPCPLFADLLDIRESSDDLLWRQGLGDAMIPVDLSGKVSDPLALLLQVQVGGGTHIGLGLRAARAGLRSPTRSMVVLVSDFEEGVSVGEMVGEVRALASAGTKCVGLAALDDSGTARFHQGYAQLVAAAGMPVAAVSPENLARWVGDQIRGQSRSGGGVQAGPVGASAL